MTVKGTTWAKLGAKTMTTPTEIEELLAARPTNPDLSTWTNQDKRVVLKLHSYWLSGVRPDLLSPLFDYTTGTYLDIWDYG